MSNEEALFDHIADKLVSEHEWISRGKMMSSPGIRYRNKVFAFYHQKEMVFRLGKSFDPQLFKITNYSLLNPFKNKAPLSGWFQISYEHHLEWEKLARRALKLIVTDLG